VFKEAAEISSNHVEYESEDNANDPANEDAACCSGIEDCGHDCLKERYDRVNDCSEEPAAHSFHFQFFADDVESEVDVGRNDSARNYKENVCHYQNSCESREISTGSTRSDA
jgi:hypothetical protein